MSFFDAIEKNDIEKAATNVYHCRKMIANSHNKEQSKDVDMIIKKGMLAKLTEILKEEYTPERSGLLQETSWCVSNMAGSNSEHVKEIIQAGTIDAMLRLFLLEQNYSILDNVIILIWKRSLNVF